jgi:predicted acylesterase/phospholipase RssA
MQRHAPGIVIGSDVGDDRTALRNRRRINIVQILMQAGMVNSAATAAAQRSLADVLLKPPLANVDLLNWRAFDRAIDAGYDYTRRALDQLHHLPRMHRVVEPRLVSSLVSEIEARAARPAPLAATE